MTGPHLQIPGSKTQTACASTADIVPNLVPLERSCITFTANPPDFAAAHAERVPTANWPGVGSCSWDAQTSHGLTESPEHEYGNTLSFFPRFQGQGEMYFAHKAQSLVQDPWFVCVLEPQGCTYLSLLPSSDLFLTSGQALCSFRALIPNDRHLPLSIP
jgi:hypothetical protein